MGKETELVLRMASEEFTAKGLMILEKNWLEIYSPWVGSWITPRITPPLPLSGDFIYYEEILVVACSKMHLSTRTRMNPLENDHLF